MCMLLLQGAPAVACATSADCAQPVSCLNHAAAAFIPASSQPIGSLNHAAAEFVPASAQPKSVLNHAAADFVPAASHPLVSCWINLITPKS